MEYLKAFGLGISFVVGILVAVTAVLACFRASAKKEKSDTVVSLLRLEGIQRETVVQLARVAEVLEKWLKRESDKSFHGGQ
jgi:hypothetical protein